MLNFIKNKFLFILLISIATLVVLVVGALSLYKDNSLVFTSDGYIIETSTKTNTKYYFTANTKYKENVEEKITFSDKDNNKVAVDPASFVHYDNGNVTFLKKGALVNLADITAPMVSYYNITNENTIVYEQEHYTVTSNDKRINIDSFVGRINDSKYLIAGKDLALKIPTEEARISGDYFEINYIEEGIIKIDNKDHSYQVTAQDSYIYIGENITISLGDGKIFYDGEAKMLLSQITINGDENIDLDVEKEISGGGSGDGSGSGTGEGSGEDGDGTGEGTGEGIEGDGTGEGEGTGEGDGADTGTGGNGNGNGTGEGDNTTASPQIELIEAVVTSTTIDLTMQLNNADLAKGNIVAYLTNVATGDKETPKKIELTNGTFKLPYASLFPNTDYALTIIETGIENEKQYFQKTFKTKELGLTLEKTYATKNSLAYKIIFDENTEVTEAHITIDYLDEDDKNQNTPIKENEFTFSNKPNGNKEHEFTGLKSNTRYIIEVDSVIIGNKKYDGVYEINRKDTTLKEKPIVLPPKITANAEEVKFTIELDNITDNDKSIISYTYNIYLADEIGKKPNTNNLIPQYSITKKDSTPLVLDLNEINELKTGINYKCEVVAEYDDNEMIREEKSGLSGDFLIKSKPKLDFKLSATMNSISGTITLIDANCTVPMPGRYCRPVEDNDFILRYYDTSEDGTTENDTIISFNPSTLTTEPLSLTGLKSNTTYAIQVIGKYYDDKGNVHTGYIGETKHIKTDESTILNFKVIGDNISGQEKDGEINISNVVTFDAKFTAPQKSDENNQQDIKDEKQYIKEIHTVTFNLYSGRYTNDQNKLIGSYTIVDETEEKTIIEDLFSNITIRNSLFTDVTKNNLGQLNTIDKLIKVTNNLAGTLSNAYTVEVANVSDENGNQFFVENNAYTFNLTPSYYLDARIATNPNENYVTVTPILKENLTEEEYQEVTKEIKNLDDLNPQTIIGLDIENSLSDIFVDSAYKPEDKKHEYEKAIVNYTICNDTLYECDKFLSALTDNNPDNDETAKNSIKIISVDMGNKYQPETQTVYLGASEDDIDNKKDTQFIDYTRGYTYKIGFYITFKQEDGATSYYKNKVLHKLLPIERQNPLYTQYISTSSSTGVTYRYSFTDIDSALADKNFYYTLGENTKKYEKIEKSLTADGKQHDVTLPINTNNKYTLYYARKNTDNKFDYVEIATNDFETEYNYNNEEAYTILDLKNNVLRIKLENNDVTNRAIAYKVVISSKDNNNLNDYTRYFLASKLSVMSEDTGQVDEEGNQITNDYKYIDVDYANISKFMGHNLKVTIYSYYDSGLVGYNQPFNNGLILKNRETKKFLNIYNSGSNTESTSKEENANMGLYLLKEPIAKDGETIFIYNQLKDTKTYNPLLGASYYDTKELSENIGIKFNTTPINAGMLLTNGKTDYLGYDAKVLKEAQLNTNNDSYKFEAIVPTIQVNTNTANTINSIKISMVPSGIYGNKQFSKDNKAHNKIYVELYSDAECTNLLTTKETNINITGNDETGYEATINSVEFSNLNPETTYYFKVYAYVNNERIQLYDSSSKTSYITKTYASSTLNSKGIISSIKFWVEPKTYKGETSEKYVTWKLGLKNTENYKIRFELYKPNGTTTETNPETGEEVTITNFEAVKFDGTDANSCDINATGESRNGYVKNCYVLVDKNDISTINKKDQVYKFTGNDFVFGGNYYKMLVYAIPYTNGKYDEDTKVLLYQNDSLTTTPTTETVNGVEQNITIPFLEEASFSLSNSLSSGYANEKEGYYISFKPTVYDNHKVIKYGSYTIKLKDKEGKIHQTKDNVTAGIAETGIIGEEIKFTGLKSNTQYIIEITYNTYRNNIGFTPSQKEAITPFTDLTYTPINNGITLGSIKADMTKTQEVTLTYTGASDLGNQIVRVDYTISLLSGSGTTTGTYRINENNSSIFTVKTDKKPRLIIDTSDSKYSTNTSFTFGAGSSYMITTQYYYLNEDGEEELLMDQVTGETKFTTIL